MSTNCTLLFAPPLNGHEAALIFRDEYLIDDSICRLTDVEQQQADAFISLWQRSFASRYNRSFITPTLSNTFVLLIWQDGWPDVMQRHLIQSAVQLANKFGVSSVLVSHEHLKPIKFTQAIEQDIASQPQIQFELCQTDWHHALLLSQARAVICGDSWLGFEALLWRKPVYSSSASFYQPLTLSIEQEKPVVCFEQKNNPPTVEYWVWCLFFKQARRVDYDSQELKIDQNMMAALSWLELQKQQRSRFAPHIYAIGFNYHWRTTLQQFLQGSVLSFVKSFDQIPAGSQAVIWGNRTAQGILDPSIRLIRLEDGFLRSVGLGSQFSQPLSWVADRRGLYFDATRVSDLEVLLNTHPLGKELQQRAKLLVNQLVSLNLSKYNTGKQHWQRPMTSKKVILVTGQVESDASIAFGAPEIKTNLALLQAVRAANPTAFIIYKPHPDVVAGARASGQHEHHVGAFCDEILTDVNITAVIPLIDEVHVLTSLSGFEALLRGKPVHCYGLPFYAGWGLTTDHCLCERRTRRLDLSQLVAAVLLLYPLYLNRHSGYYCSAEQTLEHLCQWREKGPDWRQKAGIVVRALLNKIIGKH